MSKKCKAYSESKLGLEPPDNRKAFYAGWDAALRAALAEPDLSRCPNCKGPADNGHDRDQTLTPSNLHAADV